jgi:hypothetical protein
LKLPPTIVALIMNVPPWRAPKFLVGPKLGLSQSNNEIV